MRWIKKKKRLQSVFRGTRAQAALSWLGGVPKIVVPYEMVTEISAHRGAPRVLVRSHISAHTGNILVEISRYSVRTVSERR